MSQAPCKMFLGQKFLRPLLQKRRSKTKKEKSMKHILHVRPMLKAEEVKTSLSLSSISAWLSANAFSLCRSPCATPSMSFSVLDARLPSWQSAEIVLLCLVTEPITMKAGRKARKEKSILSRYRYRFWYQSGHRGFCFGFLNTCIGRLPRA
jgi:hypothetical protein